MGSIIPVPRGSLGPYDVTALPDPGGPPEEIVPRWMPDEGDALLALFQAFPQTQVLQVTEERE